MPNLLKYIQDFIIYEELANFICNTVNIWNYFEGEVIGKQLFRATELISANIAESNALINTFKNPLL